ncbi:low molecular weight protein-tyrosine-phosphatase [Galactobacter valiniphilus]|uniref:low molecular weight protein-tyrosine-phosphatase n=1 Tax=Galactobacter valiniphilus TaxID=2676122 RepID=UPI003736F737
MYRIMTVCTGNICRSPLAEYVLREALADAGLGESVRVEGGGISDEEHGRPMDRRALAQLRGLGIDGSAHRARELPSDAWEDTDLFLAADLNHLRFLRRHAPSPDHRERVRLLRSFDPASAALPEERQGMADPWYGDESDFVITRDQVLASVPGVVEFVRAELGAGA